MSDNSRRVLMAGVVVTMLVILAVIVLVLGRTQPRPPLPNPNGYDDFAKAGKVLTGEVGDYLTLDQDSLRDLVATNTEPLRLLRLGLSRTCVIPYDEAIKNFGATSLALGTTKSLAQLLAAEGRLKELDDRIGEAASVYAEAICLEIGQAVEV